jgi:hypothetical protein
VEAFQILKMEVEEQFGANIHAALPLFHRHTQLTMAHYFNDAAILGANATLPQVMDLIEIIKYWKWPQLPQLSPRYTHAIRPGGLVSGTNSQPSGRHTTNGTATDRTPKPGSPGNSQRVLNLTPNSVLMTRFERTNKQLRDLTPHGTVTLQGDNGTEELCLSHILR